MAVGDFFSKIRGITGTILQIGLGGPQIKNESGTLAARNAADAAYAIARGADPVGNNDLVNLQYFNANNASANGLTYVKMTLALSTVVSTTAIPNNAIIMDCRVEVGTAYSGGATLQITRTGDGTKVLQATSDNDLTNQGVYQVPQTTDWGSTGAGTVTATIAGGPATGAAIVYIGYTTPTAI